MASKLKGIPMKHEENRYLRLWQIIGSKKFGTQPIIPLSRSSWLAGVKDGRFPKPIKLGPRVTVWNANEVLDLIISGKDGVK
jgi:predicted DNA-binding transcriptional regulator AlpA